MQTLKCSRCTMLPTVRASRSSSFSFSGAFMRLVYSPDTFREIGVIRGDRLRHWAAQKPQVFGARLGGQRRFVLKIVVEPGLGPDIARFVRAFQAKAAFILLPREKGPAGQKRRRVAARRDELDVGDEHARRVLLAEEDRALHHRVHEGGAEGPRKAPPL